MNQDEKLIRMANQIAAFFKSYPEEEARTGIAEHIASFWTPKMRSRLDARILAGEPGKRDALVVRAVRRSVQAESPAHRVTEGPAQAGEVGAMDAG